MLNGIQKTLEEVQPIFHKGEKVLKVINQSHLTSLSPDGIVLTNERLIIVHHSFWGYHIGVNLLTPTELHVISYPSVSSVTFSNGKLLTSIKVFVQGGVGAQLEEGQGSWNLHSLWRKQALEVMNILQEMISKKDNGAAQEAEDVWK